MEFDPYLWVFIKSFLFNPNDIQRRIRHNKQNLQTQLIFKLHYLPSRYDLYHKIMEELSDTSSNSDSDLDSDVDSDFSA
jgi:hypothetical protein